MTDAGTNGLSALSTRARRRAEEEAEAYSATAEEDRPLRGYAALLGIYLSYVLGLVGIGRQMGARLPERLAPADIALVAVATHKVARILTKDPVTSPVRAPFTRFGGPSGDGEIHEEVRGTGLRHAIGELLTCPFCIAQWIATLFAFGLVVAPRPTRLCASVFAAVTGADLLQFAYARAQSLGR